MRYCGGDDVFCPPFTVAPVRVHSGFYTADYIYEVCPPGQWRNLTILLRSNDHVGNSPISTQQPLWECQLCPKGTYKAVAGDPISMCRPCDAAQSVSSEDRITCDCLTGTADGYTALFNITTGHCQRYHTSQIALIDAHMWAQNTSLTRYQQFPCEPGHYCENGLRFKCPHGRYGALTQETRPLCEGVCTQGYFCLESSTSPMSFPCGAAKFICPEGSYTPTLVPPGYYSNEDVPENLRYTQSICPRGYYCPGDGRRYACSKGTYTSREGTVEASCMGRCERGMFSTAVRCISTVLTGLTLCVFDRPLLSRGVAYRHAVPLRQHLCLLPSRQLRAPAHPRRFLWSLYRARRRRGGVLERGQLHVQCGDPMRAGRLLRWRS
jgi:hypothetical protein